MKDEKWGNEWVLMQEARKRTRILPNQVFSPTHTSPQWRMNTSKKIGVWGEMDLVVGQRMDGEKTYILRLARGGAGGGGGRMCQLLFQTLP